MIASWRKLVRQYIYPALLGPPATLCFADQFVDRPTGSRTAVIITGGAENAILHIVTYLLSTNPYVVVT